MARFCIKFSAPSRLICLLALVLGLQTTVLAQDYSAGGADSQSVLGNLMSRPNDVTITISVRDARGLPLEDLATVRLLSRQRSFNRSSLTKESANVSFQGLLEGPYEVHVECPGYRPVQEQLDVTGGSAFFTAYIYMHTITDPNTGDAPPKELQLTPKATMEVDKGLSAMRRKQYDSAMNHFSKASKFSPSNPDIYYFRGSAKLKLGQKGPARSDFEQAVALEPSFEKALLALSELQLEAGESALAITTLNKTVTENGASWKTYYLLSTAYANLKQWKDASASAHHAVSLARQQAAPPLLLLGKIQAEAGSSSSAKETWERLIEEFPNAPEAAEAKEKLTEMSEGKRPTTGTFEASKLALDPKLSAVEEDRSWAPPDIDSKEYNAIPDAACNVDDVIARAMRREKAQLANLERFAATEHIEHQEIDNHGMPGPIKTRQFSYLVFVYPQQGDSVFLEESRDGGTNTAAFPTSLATVGLNSLGISVLQPTYRPGFQFRCEGVATVRGAAAWQVRFEEKKGADLGVRRWQRQGTIYNIPIKGRLWLATTTYDILRIETDLREPVPTLDLARDHLQVEYGPVNFTAGKMQLWLPWDAEMFLELHGKRYHHKHFLTDYMLFGVDTSHKISLPKGVPQEVIEDEHPTPEKPQP